MAGQWDDSPGGRFRFPIVGGRAAQVRVSIGRAQAASVAVRPVRLSQYLEPRIAVDDPDYARVVGAAQDRQDPRGLAEALQGEVQGIVGMGVGPLSVLFTTCPGSLKDDGGRCRIRTYDFHRVRMALYR